MVLSVHVNSLFVGGCHSFRPCIASDPRNVSKDTAVFSLTTCKWIGTLSPISCCFTVPYSGLVQSRLSLSMSLIAIPVSLAHRM